MLYTAQPIEIIARLSHKMEYLLDLQLHFDGGLLQAPAKVVGPIPLVQILVNLQQKRFELIHIGGFDEKFVRAVLNRFYS